MGQQMTLTGTGNRSFRFKENNATAKGRIKAHKKTQRAPSAGETEPF
ncbi:MAG: hypothetical protein ACYCVY_09525 [Acidiferrobacteraceae bacterium]